MRRGGAALVVSLTLVAAHAAAGAGGDDPLVTQQWYRERSAVFLDPTTVPPLAPVRVAVIDSGVDLGHPDLAGRIVAFRNFVDHDTRDVIGHGTIVAGLIAAVTDNGVGIAGLAPSAQLIVAKIARPGGGVDVGVEAKALRWAVDRGARVVNLSLGGLRDPDRPARDECSRDEQLAIAYAVRHGVLVVAAVGNGDQAPREPWPYASWPAALPHVLGVSAVTSGGRVPSFSNRDRLFNDLSAPGVAITATFPRSLTATRAGCAAQGYTPCATGDLERPEGTSFAAALVTAAAANLFALRPSLRAEQVAAILERTARDRTPANGCAACSVGRDPLTGWGELDGAAALAALARELPPPDAHEPNDDAGRAAYRLWFGAGRPSRIVDATLDFWDDRNDVYAVHLRRGQGLWVSLRSSRPGPALALWSPRTSSVDDLGRQGFRLRVSQTAGLKERLAWRATQTGWHFVEARMVRPGGPVPYRLTIVRSR